MNSLRVRFHSLGVPAKGDQDELLSELRKVLATSKPEEFARSLTPEEMATPLGNAALEAWLASDSLAACVWIAGRPDAGDSEAWLVAHVLAQQPATLAEFCRQLGATPWAETFLDYTSREMLHRSPVAAVSFAESLPRGERRARLFDAIAFDWMDRDATAASAWIGALHDPELRQRLAAVAAEAYATTKPAVAVEWLLNQAPRDGVPLEPLQTIVGIWQQTAPREAEAWLKLLRNAELANELAAKR